MVGKEEVNRGIRRIRGKKSGNRFVRLSFSAYFAYSSVDQSSTSVSTLQLSQWCLQLFPMQPQPTLAEDMSFLGTLTFQKPEELEPLMTDIHAILADPELKQFHKFARTLRGWVLVPFSLWIIEFKTFGAHACKQMRIDRKLDRTVAAILGHLEALPPKMAQQLVAEREALVRQGNYDPYLTKVGKAKYQAAMKKLLADPRFKKVWDDFCSRHDLSLLADYKGVLRRLMSSERNFRPENWKFDPTDPKSVMQAEMDCICGCFCLYGVQNGEPLLMKLTVNATPFGVMLFIPRYWSLDHCRDILWGEIKKLLKAWGVLRQGEKWSLVRIERDHLRIAAHMANELAIKEGHKATDRLGFVSQAIGLPEDTDPANLRKLISKGRALAGKGKAKKQK
jgi:hypothetical protein